MYITGLSKATFPTLSSTSGFYTGYSGSPGNFFTFSTGNTWKVKPSPIKMNIRLLNQHGRKYWTTLEVGDAVKIDHCRAGAIDLMRLESCKSCAWTTGSTLDYLYCFANASKVGESEKVNGIEFIYLERGEFDILGHICEGNHSIDLMVDDNDKVLIQSSRKICLLCEVNLRGMDMLNFLRLKQGTS